MQRNWIGRSEGARLTSDLSHHDIETKEIEVFHHPPRHRVRRHLHGPGARAPARRALDRPGAARRGRGLRPARRAPRPRSSACLPSGRRPASPSAPTASTPSTANAFRSTPPTTFLLGYGSGAVMGVPAHDQRDFEFATKYGLPVRVVISPPDWDGAPLDEAYLEQGVMVNSGRFDGTPGADAFDAVTDFAEAEGFGARAITYRMRDWLISRQRYWGTPIPIIYCDGCGAVPVPADQLPVLLPGDAEFRPTGESPLTRHEGFLHADCPRCGAPARRETDTMDTFVDSSWYFLRYASPHYGRRPLRPHPHEGMGPSRPVHRRRRARRDAPPLRPLLHQGPARPGHHRLRRALPPPLQPRDHPGRGPREDEARAGATWSTPTTSWRPTAPTRCAPSSCSSATWDQGGAWSPTGIQGMSRWLNRVWALAARDPRVASRLRQRRRPGAAAQQDDTQGNQRPRPLSSSTRPWPR